MTPKRGPGVPKGTKPWDTGGCVAGTATSAFGRKAAKYQQRELAQEAHRVARQRASETRESRAWALRRRRRRGIAPTGIMRPNPEHPGHVLTSEQARALGLAQRGKHYRRRPLCRPKVNRVAARARFAYKPDPSTGVAWWPDLRVWIGPESPEHAITRLVTLTERTALKRLRIAGALSLTGTAVTR